MSTGAWKDIALGEEAAVYAYGVIAARFPAGVERNRAADLVVVHARARDRARAALAAADSQPDLPAVFEMPFPVDSSLAARRLAAVVESRLVDVYTGLAGDFEGDERKAVVAAGAECAARAVTWGARPAAFPGARANESQPTSRPATSASRSPTASAVAGDGAVLSR